MNYAQERQSRKYSVCCSAVFPAALAEIPARRLPGDTQVTENKGWHVSCSLKAERSAETIMLTVNVDHIGDLAIVECDGGIVHSRAAFQLRDAVTSQSHASTVVLELSEVHAIEGGGLGMLIFLQRWARDHDIRFKLFNPSKSVRERLGLASALSEFDIPALDEMMALLGHADSRYAVAA